MILATHSLRSVRFAPARPRTARHLISTVLLAGLVVAGSALPASAVSAQASAEPANIGVDGELLFSPLPEMIPADSTAQGQLEKGIDGDFFSAVRTRTGAATDGRIYRYFEYEDDREPTFWNVSDAGVAGPVLSLATDGQGFVYSLHTATEPGTHGLVAKWSAVGQLQSTRSITMPGEGVLSVVAIDVDPSGEILSSLIVSDPEEARVANVWSGTWDNPLPEYGASASVSEMENTSPPFSRDTLTTLYPEPEEHIVFQYQPNQSMVYFDLGVTKGTVIFRDTRGIDTDGFNDGLYMYYSMGDSVSGGSMIMKTDHGSFANSPILRDPVTEGFDLHQSRVGSDGRLYVSGKNTRGEWAVKPFDMTELKSPELGYPTPALTVNTCATDEATILVDSEKLLGNPKPTWFGLEAGELPAGILLHQESGTVSGRSAEPFAERDITIRAANGVATTDSSEPTTTQLTLKSVTEPIAFDAAPAPVVSGTPVLGKTLSVSPGSWQPSPELTVQWMRDGVPIEGATDREYVVLSDDVGADLTVVVTGQAECRTVTNMTSDPITGLPVPKPPTPGGTPPESPAAPKPPLSNTGSAGPELAWLGGAALIGVGGLLTLLRRRAQARNAE